MQANAEQAVQHARHQYKWDLDYSPESLQRVDKIIDVLHVEMPKSALARAIKGAAIDEEVWTAAKMWGAYVGETLRHLCGGRWRTTPSVDGHAEVLFETPLGKMRPIEHVRHRLTEGAGDGVFDLYRELVRRNGGPFTHTNTDTNTDTQGATPS
jgi:hypothetical protein